MGLWRLGWFGAFALLLLVQPARAGEPDFIAFSAGVLIWARIKRRWKGGWNTAPASAYGSSNPSVA